MVSRRKYVRTRRVSRADGLLIGELSAMSGVSARTIRFYEGIGLLPPPRRAENDYRLYGPEDAERLRFIRNARSLDFTLDDVRDTLALRDRGEAPCRHVLALLKAKEVEVEVRIRELQDLQQELRSLLLKAGNLPDDDIEMKTCVCHLIRERKTSLESDSRPAGAVG